MKKVGVIGAGLSGLTFASLVPEAELLEKGQHPGGLASSITDSGYVFDLGSHIVFSNNKQVLDFMLQLLGDNKINHRRNTKILYKGKFVKYPFENGLGDLPKGEALDCVLDYIGAVTQPVKRPANFSEWMNLRFGKAISDKYLYPYNAKIWDFPPERMATFWVDGRVPQPPLRDVVKAAMGMESEGYLHQLDFYYPKKGGYQALTDALVARVGKGRIKTGFSANKIRKEDGSWVVGDGAQERVYDKLVSTIHIRDFLNAFEGADADVRNVAGSLKWNSIYLVMIGLKVPKLNDVHWCYLPDKELLPNRISFPSNYSPHVAPEGHSSVLAEITFDPKGEKARLRPDEVISRTVEDLHSAGVLKKSDVVFTKLVTWPYAYVVYDLDYEKNMALINRFAEREGVTLLGRFSEFKYINADKCIESAMEKAKLFR
jgi:protoporphyrinogen oxidase